MDDSHFLRGIKGILLGGLVGASLFTALVSFFEGNFGVDDVLPGAAVGAALGFILGVCLPRGQLLPNNLTSLVLLGLGAFSLWVLADGFVEGEIHGIPRRHGFFQGFNDLASWKLDAISFLICALFWALIAVGSVSGAVWTSLKVSGRTSTLASLPGARTVLVIYSEFRALPENYQIVTIVVLAVLLLFWPLLYFAFVGLFGD